MTDELSTRIIVINQHAARCARQEFFDHVKKAVPDYFTSESGKKAEKEVLSLAEKLSSDREEQYIVKNSSEYDQPHFDMSIDANEFKSA